MTTEVRGYCIWKRQDVLVLEKVLAERSELLAEGDLRFESAFEWKDISATEIEIQTEVIIARMCCWKRVIHIVKSDTEQSFIVKQYFVSKLSRVEWVFIAAKFDLITKTL